MSKSTAPAIHRLPARPEVDPDITLEDIRDEVSVRLSELNGLVQALAVCDGCEEPAWLTSLRPIDRSGVMDAVARMVADIVAVQHQL